MSTPQKQESITTISILLPASSADTQKAKIRELQACLTGLTYEIVVVSPFPVTGANLVHLPCETGRSYTGSISAAYAQAKGDYLCFWREDCTPTPGCFGEMLGYLKKASAPVLACFRLLNPNRDERPQPTAFGKLHAWLACGSRATFEMVGGLTESLAFEGLGLVDLSLRFWAAGFSVTLCPDAFARLQQAAAPQDTLRSDCRAAADFDKLCAKWLSAFPLENGASPTWSTVWGELPVYTALRQAFAARPYLESQAETSSIPAGAPPFRLSVIVSLYNSERYIRGLLEDLEKQTIADQCEIVIVETGSQQNERAIIHEFQARYKNIRYIHVPKRESMYAALNRALCAASCEIVVMANADDRHFPEAFARMVTVMESRPEIGLVYADSGITSSANVAAEDAKLHAVFKWPEHREGLLFRGCYIGPQPMWRKSLNETYGYFDEDMTIAGDMDMWLRFAQGAKFAHVPETLGVYLQNPGGLEISNKERCDRETRTVLLRYWPRQQGELPPFNSNYAVGVNQDAPRKPLITAPMKSDKIIALVSSYNEGDIIYHAIGDLIVNGIEVYLLDNHSTDNTVEQASKWLGKGLLKIERFPDDAGPEYSTRCKDTFVLMEILKRKEQLAIELNASWYIQADVDEFRETPWPGLSLAEGIRKVDRLGYNAINFELLNFRPTDDNFVPGSDVREYLVSYEPGESFDALQIRAWKNQGLRTEIARNGGCNINFQGRKIFPLYFILRHYPIRGETHGRVKVLKERMPRFAAEEVAHQWHIQYNDLANGKAKFLHKPENLIPYDRNRVCAEIMTRFAEDMLVANAVSGAPSIVQRVDLNALTEWVRVRLKLPTSFPAELVVQGEKAIAQLLPTQEHGYKEITAKLDPVLVRLLIAMLEVRISISRISGDSLMAQISARLKKSLTNKLAE